MISKNNSCVIKASSFYPPTEMYSSADIENQLSSIYEKLHLPYGRLEEMTGIKQRGFYDEALFPSDIAALSAKQLLQDEAIDSNEIQALIYCGVCRDGQEPSTSSKVHHLLGLANSCLHFDVSNACLGIMNGIQLAYHLLQNERFHNVLVTTGENSAPLMKKLISELNHNPSFNRKTIKPHIASLTLGSASLSFLISRQDITNHSPKIYGFHWLTNTKNYNLCHATGDYRNPEMVTDSEHLLHEGIELGKNLWNSWPSEHKKNLSFYVCHQVGKAHEELLKNSLGLHNLNTMKSYDQFGNTGSAAVGLSWHLALKNNHFKKGQQGVWLGIGSGLNAMIMHVEV